MPRCYRYIETCIIEGNNLPSSNTLHVDRWGILLDNLLVFSGHVLIEFIAFSHKIFKSILFHIINKSESESSCSST